MPRLTAFPGLYTLVPAPRARAIETVGYPGEGLLTPPLHGQYTGSAGTILLQRATAELPTSIVPYNRQKTEDRPGVGRGGGGLSVTVATFK